LGASGLPTARAAQRPAADDGGQPYFSLGVLVHPPTGKVLLHLRGDDAPSNPSMWHLFGGRSEAADGGDPVETWRREMREELGIDLPAHPPPAQPGRSGAAACPDAAYDAGHRW
jgi:8-oxo-dGTP pyrophosphatase MutT (NUDIX family)